MPLDRDDLVTMIAMLDAMLTKLRNALAELDLRDDPV
jgi:hypothetical protein